MARKTHRRPKACPRQLTPRELRDADRLLRIAGGGNQLRRQLEEYYRVRRPRGQPRKDGCDPLIDSILASGGLKLRRPQIRAIAEALWDFGWFVQFSEPVRATKGRETPTVAPWDPHHLARNRKALTARLEKELRKRASRRAEEF
jgi:hypothetical protein